jgi:hypothetical protein
MLVRNAKIADLEKALKRLNKKYKNNIVFKTLEQKGKAISFTLTAVQSKRRGARTHINYNFNGSKKVKYSSHACWHAHGHFFEELFLVAPDAYIAPTRMTCGQGIDADGGNWQDTNIGSEMYPLYASEACECALYDDLGIDDLQEYVNKIKAMDLETVRKFYDDSDRQACLIVQNATFSLMPLLINDPDKSVLDIVKRRLAKGK